MGSGTSPTGKTLADFMALGDETRGELTMTSSPSLRHQTVVANLILLLGPYVREGHRGRMWVAPLDVYLPSGDVVEPDLVFVASANEVLAEDGIRGVPDLLIEILSPGNARRDRVVKRDLYEQNRVPEFWIADPGAQTIEVLHLDGHAYASSGCLGMGAAPSSRVLPELRLAIDEIFSLA